MPLFHRNRYDSTATFPKKTNKSENGIYTYTTYHRLSHIKSNPQPVQHTSRRCIVSRHGRILHTSWASNIITTRFVTTTEHRWFPIWWQPSRWRRIRRLGSGRILHYCIVVMPLARVLICHWHMGDPGIGVTSLPKILYLCLSVHMHFVCGSSFTLVHLSDALSSSRNASFITYSLSLDKHCSLSSPVVSLV